MDFNKDKIFEKLTQQSPDFKTKKLTQEILLGFGIDISFSHIFVSKNSISIKNINLYQKITLKKNKKEILTKIQSQNPYIRDII